VDDLARGIVLLNGLKATEIGECAYRLP